MRLFAQCCLLLGLLAGSWAAEGSWAETGRRSVYGSPTAVLLASGKVLSLGASSTSQPAHCELFDPDSGTWSPTGSLLLAPDTSSSSGLTPVLLKNGKVLLIERRGSGPSTCEVYDPDTGTWSRTGSLARPLMGSMAFCLDNGKVLRVGGWDLVGDSPDRTYEMYDPEIGVWVESGTIPKVENVAAAALLPSGKVLIIGSSTNWSGSRECQLYDPASNTWSTTGMMSRERGWIVTSVLESGDVLISGGANGSGATAECELYDHATGSWRQVGSLSGPRIYHAAVVLPTGKVLAWGGWGNSGALESCELFDPVTARWTAAAPTLSLSPGQGFNLQSIVLANSGKVLAMDRTGDCELFSGSLDRPLVSVIAHTRNATPAWNWTSSGGGNGTFRWKLDNGDLTSGSAQGPVHAFTPSSPLANGTHILYVQERNDGGDWSDSGVASVIIDLDPPSASLTASATTFGYGSTVMLSVTFSESVVGFAAGKLLATNARIGAVVASTDQRMFTVPMTIGPPGPVHVSLPPYSVVDFGGNFLMAEADLNLTAVVGPSTRGTSEVEGDDDGGCGVGGAATILLGVLCVAGFGRQSRRFADRD